MGSVNRLSPRQRMGLRQAMVSLTSTLVGVFTVVGMAALFAVWSMNRAWEAGLREQVQWHALVQLNQQTQIDFKTQVQEWKNVLLRGQSVQDLERYESALHMRQERVQGQLQALADQCLAAGLTEPARALNTMQAEYRRINEGYARALSQGMSGRDRLMWEDARRIDAQIRGIDRAFEPRMAAIAQSIGQQAQSASEQLPRQMRQRYAWLRQFLLALLLGSGLLVGLGLVMALRATRE